jgi:hypothetical protein
MATAAPWSMPPAPTRDLPAPDGSVIAAAEVHRIEVITLGDNFATLVPNAKALV